MSWKKLAGCVGGVMLLILAGCADTDFLSFNFLQTGRVPGASGDRVVAGSLETVSQSTQAGLGELGITTVLTQEDQAVRLSCTTRAGVHFFLVLTRVKTDQGESTHIRLEWDGQPDG